MSILAALNKAKEKKVIEQIELAGKIEFPENSYWKFVNGEDGKDGYFIGKKQFKSSLRFLGVGIEIIDELLLESVTSREFFLGYFDKQINIAQLSNAGYTFLSKL
jgi:hypothetical protein